MRPRATVRRASSPPTAAFTAHVTKPRADPFQIAMSYAQLLIERGWHAQALDVVTSAERIAPNDAEKKKCAALLARCLFARSDAALALGNVEMIKSALRA